jgi:hypothetical protein
MRGVVWDVRSLSNRHVVHRRRREKKEYVIVEKLVFPKKQRPRIEARCRTQEKDVFTFDTCPHEANIGSTE